MISLLSRKEEEYFLERGLADAKVFNGQRALIIEKHLEERPDRHVCLRQLVPERTRRRVRHLSAAAPARRSQAAAQCTKAPLAARPRSRQAARYQQAR